MVVVSNVSNGTPTTSTPPDENPSPIAPAQGQPPPRQLWNSPYVTSRASEWPDEKSKNYWIGPFDMYWNTYAQKARDVDRKEDEGTCNNRKLAESLYEEGDFAGARHALAQIADQYISEYQHCSRWAPDVDFKAAWDNQDALNHIATASIGCILNAYLAQYPDLCAAIKADGKLGSSNHTKPHPVLTAVVDHEDNLTNSRALYILRVMLDFASDIEYGKDHSWMRSVYQKAFKEMGQIAGLDLSESVRLRQGLVHEIVESEREAYWHGINSNRPISWDSWNSEQREAYRTQSMQIWKDEVEELHLHIIADQQSLSGTMAEATISSELELVNHYKSVGDIEKAKAKVRQLIILTKDNLGEGHDSTLRCMASLSKILFDIGSIEEAGLVVHDCLSKHPRIRTGSTDLFSLELREKFTSRRGWKEMMVLREELERAMSPFHFIWADYRLYTLRIGTVTFAPSYIADMEKDSVWTLACQEPKHKEDGMENCSEDEESMILREGLTQQPRASSPSRPDAEKYAFNASERDHEFLDLQVPYIPYEHFVTTSAFKAGMPYLEYIKAAENWSISSHIHEESATDTPVRLSEYFKETEGIDRNSDSNSETCDEVVAEMDERKLRQYSRTFNGAGSKEGLVVEVDRAIPPNTFITDQPSSSTRILQRPRSKASSTTFPAKHLSHLGST